MSTAKSGSRRRPVSRPGHRHRHGPPGPDLVHIYGIHAARAALDNPHRTVTGAFATENAAARLADSLARRGLRPKIGSAQELAARLGGEPVHQGIVLEARPLAPARLADLGGRGPLIALDQVTDPRNLGAIWRAAAAFAAAGIIATRRHMPHQTGLIAKAASGGIEHVPLIEQANLARALEEARAAGYWVAGLDSDAEEALEAAPAAMPLVLVLGAEGQGLRRLTREKCDALYRLDMPGAVKSLNVASAAALALYVARHLSSGPPPGAGEAKR